MPSKIVKFCCALTFRFFSDKSCFLKSEFCQNSFWTKSGIYHDKDIFICNFFYKIDKRDKFAQKNIFVLGTFSPIMLERIFSILLGAKISR